ncbi:MAG: hypothetical protein U0998_06100 [Moraxellaceae bacterium]|nr:hypothetical protein [Moraxellaceae bacterium]MDZ4386775.1 hypothetical protein [Moraxellaceae bacterium]
MEGSSREFIKKDQNGFYYYDKDDGTGRYVYIRSIDLAKILGISRSGTALEAAYVDLHNSIMLSIEDDRDPDLFMYLSEKFPNATHDHMIVPTDLASADDNWSALI